MGHKINPLTFRLGVSKNWEFNLKEKNWISNFLIYQLVSNQFLKYTIPYFNRENLRNERHPQGLVIMKGEKQLMANNFIKRSILFSHLLLGSVNRELKLSCFLYEYKLTREKNKAKLFVRYNQLFSNSFLRWKAYSAYFKKLKKPLRKRSYRWFRLMIPNLWFYNFSLVSLKKTNLFKINLFRLNQIWLRLFTIIHKLTKKQRLFFFNSWSLLLINLLPMVKILANNFYNRIYLLLLTINFLNLNYKLRNSFFFVEFYRTRYFLYKAVSKSITNNLKGLLLPQNFNRVNIKYHAIREKSMTSKLLTNLILIKLGQYYRINSIVYPLINWLKRHKNVLGYRIVISGRLTRRERASHLIKSGKSMPLSSISKSLDYNQDVKIMKFGMVGIKVYLFLKKKLRNSYYYYNFVSN